MPEEAYNFRGVDVRKYNIRCSGKISWNEDHPFLAHFKSLQKIVNGSGIVKFTISSPNLLMYDYQLNTAIYPNEAAMMKDVQKAYQDAIILPATKDGWYLDSSHPNSRNRNTKNLSNRAFAKRRNMSRWNNFV